MNNQAKTTDNRRKLIVALADLMEVFAHRRQLRLALVNWRTDVARKKLARSFLVVACLALIATTSVGAQESTADESLGPLHERIDREIGTVYVGPKLPLSSDAEFLRRVYLDLVGVIPTSSEAREFLDDASSDKRTKLIDKLLVDKRFAHHMANVYDVMLNERRPDKQIPFPEWQAYLLKSFQENKPLNVLAREIISADGVDESLRPAVKFYLDREGEPNLITRDLGRVFFGVDMQCAQCHDHPHIDSYYQADYYGIFAFVNRGFVFTDKDQKVFFAEKAEGEVEFTSVFTGEQGTALPRLPTSVDYADPTFEEGELYEVAPEKDVRPVPRYSRRQTMAQAATDGTNRAFNENLANRLWAHMMGRGIVHPVDLHHDDNPATHPALLRELGDELAGHNFDVRYFLREIALSHTYQRAFDLPSFDDPGIVATDARADELASQILNAEQLLAEASDKFSNRRDALIACKDELEASIEQLHQAESAHTDAVTKHGEHVTKLSQLKLELERLQQQHVAFVEAAQASAQTRTVIEEDPAVEAAVSLFESRVASTKQALDSKTAEVAQADELADELELQVERAKAEHIVATNNLNEVRKSLATTQTEYDSWEQQRTERAEQVDRLKEQHRMVLQFRDWRLATDMIVKTGASLSEPQAQLRNDIKQRNAIVQRQADIARLKESATAEQEQLDETLMIAMTEVSTLIKRIEAYGEVYETSTSALQTIPDDSVLGQTVELMSNRLEASNSQLKTTRDSMAQATQRREALEAEIAALDQELAATIIAEEPIQANIDRLRPIVEPLERAWQDALAEESRIRSKLLENLENKFVVATLRPLGAEQLGWSLMTSTGVVANNRTSVINELDKESPVTNEQKADAAFMETREVTIDTKLREKLKSSVNLFVNLFANAGGQPQDVFFATVEQTLFLKNGSQVRSWIASGGDSARIRATNATTPEDAADEIFLSTLTRFPTQIERDAFVAELTARDGEKDAVIQEWIWGLLTSDEFRFNH